MHLHSYTEKRRHFQSKVDPFTLQMMQRWTMRKIKVCKWHPSITRRWNQHSVSKALAPNHLSTAQTLFYTKGELLSTFTVGGKKGCEPLESSCYYGYNWQEEGTQWRQPGGKETHSKYRWIQKRVMFARGHMHRPISLSCYGDLRARRLWPAQHISYVTKTSFLTLYNRSYHI